MSSMEKTTQPAGQPVAQPVKPAKKFLVALVALAVVLVVLLLAVLVGGLKLKSGSKAKAPAPSTTTTAPSAAPATTPTSGPTAEQAELLLGACYCECREKGGSVAGCLERCIPCESKECKEGKKVTKKVTKSPPAQPPAPPAPAPLAPSAPAVAPLAPAQASAARSCEGPSPTLGPEVAGLVVQGKVVTWTDPCYTKLVLYGEHGREFPLVTFNSPSKRVTLPTEYLDAGYDRFSLQTPDGRWALIHPSSKGACGVVDEGPRGHAYKLCK